MAENIKSAPVHWIDHFVVGTNDLNAWVDWAEHTIGVNHRRFATMSSSTGRSMRCSTKG